MPYKYIYDVMIRTIATAAAVVAMFAVIASADLQSIKVDVPKAGAGARTNAQEADSVVIRPASSGVTALAAPQKVTVGDSIGFEVSIVVQKNAQIIPPETEGGFGDFAVMAAQSETRAGQGDDPDTVIHRYHLATYKPVSGSIPQLAFLAKTERATLYIASDDAEIESGEHFDTLWTPPIPIRMLSVIPQGLPDSMITLRRLKDQQRAGRMSLVSLWLLLIAIAAGVAYYILEKRARKNDTSTIPAVALKPPYEEAIELIGELDDKRLIERGEAREYVFQLSEIFKRYIGRRFDTIAPELTTEEIVAWLEFSELSRETRLCAERFFRESDQVKYAKQLPDRQTLDEFKGSVIAFLETTKPSAETVGEKKTQNTGAAS